MIDERARRAKLLFVLSTDFGELSNALYLVAGSDFRPTLLLPPALHEINARGLPVPAARYQTVDDVLRVVDAEAPDLVFLFSGYLYGADEIFDLPQLARLVAELDRRGCRVLTSDPFLGVLARLDAATFSDRHPLKAQLARHFGQVFATLSPLTHVYLADPAGFAGTPAVSFYNERIVAAAPERAAWTAELAAQGFSPARRRWLFILSAEDYGGQANLLGRAAFDERLVAKLRETASEGREPVLLAPPICIEGIRARVADVDGLTMLPFVDYGLFRALLLEAEYVFYWNLFSSTIPIRMLNESPFFLFAPGHMATAIPAVFHVGMREFYRDALVIYADPAAPLVADELPELAATWEERGVAAARAHFRRSPSPEQMVERLLSEPRTR